MTALVFGSLNMDLVTRAAQLPQPGETLIGSQFFTTPGGKGGNQAVALARLGIATEMVGRVGGDSFGQELLAALRQAGVGCDRLRVQKSVHSGVAIIIVTETGENQIIGVLGANGQMDASDVDRLLPLLPQASVLLMQLEIPLGTVKLAATAARQAGVPVLLDPAPVPGASLQPLYPLVDILLPNEVEASQLVGFAVTNQETAARAATQLQQQGASTVMIKLGAQGAFCATPDRAFFVPAFPVQAVDSVAAGDAFAGGLATALVEGLPLERAIAWGNAAGALAVRQVGAQSAMPDRATFDAFLAERGLV